jgi:RNA polymerase sigma-70 factor, ECF subfamily
MALEIMSMAVDAAGDAAMDLVETAVRDHTRLVYKIACSVLRNTADAEDATQETFLRVLRQRKRLSEVEDVKNWVARIAWRVAVGRRKKLCEVPLHEATESVEQTRIISGAAEEVAITAQSMNLLHRLITGLPGDLRDPLVLSTVQEMSPPDIAQVLGTSAAAVRARLFRARGVLREKMFALTEGKHGK